MPRPSTGAETAIPTLMQCGRSLVVNCSDDRSVQSWYSICSAYCLGDTRRTDWGSVEEGLVAVVSIAVVIARSVRRMACKAPQLDTGAIPVTPRLGHWGMEHVQ